MTKIKVDGDWSKKELKEVLGIKDIKPSAMVWYNFNKEHIVCRNAQYETGYRPMDKIREEGFYIPSLNVTIIFYEHYSYDDSHNYESNQIQYYLYLMDYRFFVYEGDMISKIDEGEKHRMYISNFCCEEYHNYLFDDTPDDYNEVKEEVE